MKTNFYVDWTTLIWRFEINFEKIAIQFFKNCLNFNDKMFDYALMYSTFDIEKISKICKLFKFLKSYENCFNFKNAKILFEYKDENHVINLIFDAKLLYELFYIFFKIKLDVLKFYLLKNLILNCIRKFTSRANALIFFIFKKTIIFDFMSIIKNWMFWSSRINARFR